MGLLAELHSARMERAWERARMERSAFDFGPGGLVSVAEVPGSALGTVVWDGAVALSNFLVVEHVDAAKRTAQRARAGPDLPWPGPGLPYEERHIPPDGEEPVLLTGRRIVELGAGAGLPGLLAVERLGASRALLTENNDEALELLRRNAAASTAASLVHVRALDWDGSSEDAVASVRESLGGDAEVVLAADVVYTPQTARSFVSTLDALLRAARPPALAAVAYTERSAESDEAFASAMQQHRLHVVRESRLPLPSAARSSFVTATGSPAGRHRVLVIKQADGSVGGGVRSPVCRMSSAEQSWTLCD